MVAHYAFLTMLVSIFWNVGAEKFELTWYTIDGGGAMRSYGGELELSSTIGQPDAGFLSLDNGLTITGGFWFPLSPGDCNTDSAINGFDHRDFTGCLFGPVDGFPEVECQCADFDHDDDVDLADFQSLMNSFTGQ